MYFITILIKTIILSWCVVICMGVAMSARHGGCDATERRANGLCICLPAGWGWPMGWRVAGYVTPAPHACTRGISNSLQILIWFFCRGIFAFTRLIGLWLESDHTADKCTFWNKVCIVNSKVYLYIEVIDLQ